MNIVTNSKIDIDKIVAQKKRKRIFEADCKDFEILSKHDKARGLGQYANIVDRLEYVGDINSGNVYYFVLNFNGKRTIVFFEPHPKMIEAFRHYISRKIML